MIETDVMTLTEVAEYLKLSEKTIHRMIRKQEIPCSKVGGQWRFLRSLLDDWLRGQMQSIPGNELTRLLKEKDEIVPLSRLMNKDLFHMNITQGTKREILSTLIQPLVKNGFSDDKIFLEKLLEREQMASTAIGNGVALPHLRRPQENVVKEPFILVGISKEGVDYKSFDGKPTHLFFLIVTDSEIVHLKVMAKLSALLKNDEFIGELLECTAPEGFINLIIKEESKYREMSSPQ